VRFIVYYLNIPQWGHSFQISLYWEIYYCVQPFTVKQRCVLSKCISNNDNFSFIGIGFLYHIKSRGKRANHWRDREREHMKVSIGTKFSKIVQENRVGVSQEKTLWMTTVWLTTAHVDQDWNTWSKDHITQIFYFLIMTWRFYISHERHLDWWQVPDSVYYALNGLLLAYLSDI